MMMPNLAPRWGAGRGRRPDPAPTDRRGGGRWCSLPPPSYCADSDRRRALVLDLRFPADFPGEAIRRTF